MSGLREDLQLIKFVDKDKSIHNHLNIDNMTKSTNKLQSKLSDGYLKFRSFSMGKSSLFLAIGWTILGIARYIHESGHPNGFTIAQIAIGLLYFFLYFTRVQKPSDK